ncbi:hypothetical protein [Litchfieldia alkalitelluris]|uniref:hypothetical protein n=1 Tax=Litchfieldia alkalitelluris TaxID=304268 RepID=UPI001F1AF645|nr:hypothetical protein [Litchfieldia alkalitelluris]
MSELVINERVKNFAWGKLFKRDIILDITFKKGVLFEDVFWAHKVMDRVNKYLITNSPMYYYYQRNDSIVSTYNLRSLDLISGLKERHQFIELYYNELRNPSLRVLLRACIDNYYRLSNVKENYGKNKYRKEIYNYIKNNQSYFKDAVKGHKEMKIELLLFLFHPVINILFLFVKKILRKLKVIPHPPMLKKINLKNGDSSGQIYR